MERRMERVLIAVGVEASEIESWAGGSSHGGPGEMDVNRHHVDQFVGATK